MRKLILLIAATVLLAAVAWQQRLEILMWGAPKLRAALQPIGENVPVPWSVGPQSAEAPVGERPPNIILVLTDDMGFNDISLYNGGAGDGSLLTPNIDALADAGVAFANGYAANAVCAPSRASIMTGRYSTRFGFEFTPFPRIGATIFRWMQEIEQPPLPTFIDSAALESMPGERYTDLGMPEAEVTIAELLQASGYYTALIGKWHLGNAPGLQPHEQGFVDALELGGMLYLPEDSPDVVNARREEEAVERMVWTSADYAARFNGGERFAPAGYLTDYYTDEALKVIDNNRHRPFFLYLAHWGVHNPLQASRADYDALAHIEDHHLRVYSAMIRAVDRSVGRITDHLESLGLADNTLILFTSDNGGAGYIQLPDINKPYRGWKLNHFEGGTHVPFLARWPGRIPAGSRFEAPVHHVDLFHTIAAAAGVQTPTDRRMDGVDLVPFVTGERAGVPHETLFWREGHHQSVRHGDWKLIRAGRPDKRWLFDLSVDPTEQSNLAAQRPDMVRALEALLDAHNAEQAEPLWPSVIDSPQRIDKHGGEPYASDDEYIYWPN